MPNRNLILVLAPVGRDAALLIGSLARAGISARALPDPASLLLAAQSNDAGALLLTAEALSSRCIQDLSHTLEQQPHWSDLPILILVPGGAESRVIDHLEATLRVLPNMTLLERPIRPTTLASIAANALKSRARQLEVKRILEEKEETALSLIQSEKLAAVGRLASTIAHEINNPLEAITNLLYLLRNEAGLSSAGREFLESAEREVARVSQIASQTLRFHQQSTAAIDVQPQALLEEVLSIYKSRLANSHIVVRHEFAPAVQLTCYDGDVRQILSNLVSNAFDVMRTGGHLRLRTREQTWWPSGERGVVITVADDGPGMSEAVQRRAFDAFFSTKGIHGTGLGLWISCRIVEKHRGHLRLRSATGDRHGTTFRLWLPLHLTPSAGDLPATKLEPPHAEA